MADVETTRFGDLCRLCATKTNSMVLSLNIFTNEGAIRELDKKIETCLPIHVHETDELPKIICEHCLYKLELFWDFRERTVRTENLLIDLYKELNATRIQNEQISKLPHPLDVVSLDQSELLLVPHQIISEQNIQNVSQLDLAQYQNRDPMIVEHEIILSHQNMGAHSIDSLNLDHHELDQSLATEHNLPGADSILTASDMQNTRFTEENLELIHQQHNMLTEQYRLQHNLHVEIPDGIDLSMADHSVETQKVEFENHEKMENSELSVLNQDSPHNELPIPQENKTDPDSIDNVKNEDSNSSNHLSIDDSLYDQNKDSKFSDLLDKPEAIEGWFQCNICSKTFEYKWHFESHYEEHFSKCSVCLAVFTNVEALNQHKKDLHETAESNSDSESANDDSRDQIEEEEDEDDPLMEESEGLNGNKKRKWSPKICKECGKAYKTNYKLTEHMRKHTGEKPYKCSSCEKAFRSKIGLAQHEAKHTGKYDFACPICGKGFQCKSYLMVHQRVHSDVKPYPCTTCGRNFKTKQSLLDHTNRHLGVKPYMCDTCGRGFITKGLCKAHQKIHTGMDNRKYSCKVCNKMFVSKSYLQTHLRIHTGEKPFMCEVCGKGFLTRVDLRIHSTMHTGEKSYVCEMCGKAFARRDALRCHRRTHTGERPYSCDQCGQTFTQFSPMAIHKRLHTGERPYSCETCGKTFVSRSTMVTHSIKHLCNK